MLFEKDATYYAEQIKNGDVTATALVKRALVNIEKGNSMLNAVVHVQKEEALENARVFDEQLMRLTQDEIDELPPFFGVPILLKDLGQDEAGQPAMSGARLMDGFVSVETNNFVKQVLAGGFIVVGRTNVPEFGFKNETDSELTGPANSPFDPNLNTGGSSGGAAAALKAGLVPIVTAGDGGGSIRIPASMNGLIGLKTSRGRTPVGPGSFRGWQGATINFALTKSVRDTWSMLKVMQVEQYDSPFVLPLIEEETLEPLADSLKFAYSFESPVGQPVTEDAKNTVRMAVEKLQGLGHETVEATPETDGIRAMKTYYIVNAVETASMVEGMQSGMDRLVTVDDMEPMSWALYRSGYNISGVEYSQVLAFWDQLAAQTEHFFQDYDAVIMPATNGPAFSHNLFAKSDELMHNLRNIDDFDYAKQQELIWEMFQHSLAYTPFTQQQNLTGQPAISLPLYHTDEGLPIGTQIWTKKGGETLLLQIAKQLEEAGALDSDILKGQ